MWFHVVTVQETRKTWGQINEAVRKKPEIQEQQVSMILIPLTENKLFLLCSAEKYVSLSANVPLCKRRKYTYMT